MIDSGARLMPQLPVMTVVTPWLILQGSSGSLSSARSSWVWVSIKPGASARPFAEISWPALTVARSPDRDDAIVFHREIAAHARRAAAVDQQGIADHEIGLHETLQKEDRSQSRA